MTWDLNGGNVAFKETGMERWEDPGAGSDKMSLVDLTARRRDRPLCNNGCHPGLPTSTAIAGDGAMCSRNCCECHECQTSKEERGRGQQGDRNPGVADPGAGTRGLGGDPELTARCDTEALQGRLGRRQTCVVNCAIMANSYPHVGGKRYNKPIVVDLDLPVWA